jgi:tetratricopeptide (TPR) repeat protein
MRVIGLGATGAGRRNVALSFALAMMLSSGFGQIASSRDVTLNAEQMHALASRELMAGRPQNALPLAEALVAAHPDDFGAQLLLSYAARDLARFDQAEAAARRAWDLAANGEQKSSAARTIAQALSSRGARTRAQFWLRRAAQVAQTPQSKAVAIRDFRYVRARNPWSVNFDIGVSPSSNVNGGSNADTIWIYGFPFALSGDAQRLSGTEFHASVNVERTIAETKGHLTRLGFNLGGRTYRLSEDALSKAPTARGSDYAFWALEAYLSNRWKSTASPGEWDLRATAGHNEYGGAALSNYLQFNGGRRFDFEGARSLRIGASIETQWRLDSTANSAELGSVSLDYRQRIAAGIWSLGVVAGQVNSDAVTIDHDRVGVSLGFEFSKPILGTELSLSAGYEARKYGIMPFDTFDRHDHRTTIGLSAVLSEQSYMGFAPEVGLTYTRNRSNSTLYDSTDFGVSLRLRSTF